MAEPNLDLKALRRLRETLAQARWWSGWVEAVPLLDRAIAALERIPELERLIVEYRQGYLERVEEARRWRERAERVEEAAHFLLYEAGSEPEQGVALMALGQLVPRNPGLAAAPAEWDGQGKPPAPTIDPEERARLEARIAELAAAPAEEGR